MPTPGGNVLSRRYEQWKVPETGECSVYLSKRQEASIAEQNE